jgi:pimeloyl-ACP methyl ester carboxylesterase
LANAQQIEGGYLDGMPFVRLPDGQRLYVRVLGRGAPCVLVHGFASESSSWLPFVAPLLHRHRFIVPDLRGFGQSRALTLSEACPLTVYARDLACVAEAFSLRDAPLVSISMGALSSVRCFELGLGARFDRYMHIDQGLVIHNDDAPGVGLLGTAQPNFFERVRSMLNLLEQSLHTSYAALSAPLKSELAGIFAEFASAGFSHPNVQRAVRRITAEPRLLPLFLPSLGFATHVQIMRAYLERRYDLRPAFARVPKRTTVLIGGASRMYPAAGQRIVSQLSEHVRVRELPLVGHMLPLEAPREFLRELRTFLAA